MQRDVVTRLICPAAFTLVAGAIAVCSMMQLPCDADGVPEQEGPWAVPSIVAALCCGCVGPVWLGFGAYYWWVIRPGKSVISKA